MPLLRRQGLSDVDFVLISWETVPAFPLGRSRGILLSISINSTLNSMRAGNTSFIDLFRLLWPSMYLVYNR